MHTAARLVDASCESQSPGEGSDSAQLPTVAAYTHHAKAPLTKLQIAKALPEPRLLLAWMRSHMLGWLAALVSIGSVLLAWHLATHYRLEFYVRFNNIPSPADVFTKVLEVNQSTKFINNIGSYHHIIF